MRESEKSISGHEILMNAYQKRSFSERKVNFIKIPAYFSSDGESFSYMYETSFRGVELLLNEKLKLTKEEIEEIDIVFIKQNIGCDYDDLIQDKLFVESQKIYNLTLKKGK